MRAAARAAMDEEGRYDCGSCRDVYRVARRCRYPLEGDGTVSQAQSQHYPDTSLDCVCPAYDIPPAVWGSGRVSRYLDSGALSLRDVDIWYLDASEIWRAEVARCERERLRAAQAGARG